VSYKFKIATLMSSSFDYVCLQQQCMINTKDAPIIGIGRFAN